MHARLTALARRTRSSAGDEEGFVIIFVAILLVVMMGLAALVIDVGNAKQENRQAQNAADAGALAGAQYILETLINGGALTSSGVVSEVETYVQDNYGIVSWSGCSDSSPLSVQLANCISISAWPPSTSGATLLRVDLPNRTQSTKFAQAAGTGVTSINEPAYAVAKIDLDSPPSCALCTLQGASDQNGKVTVTGGDIWIDGNLSCNPQGTLKTSGSPQPPIYVDGTYSGCTSNLAPGGTSAGYNPDPYASLAVPTLPSWSGGTPPDCSSGTASPGVYRNISGTCVLSAGLYVITGTVGGSGHTTIAGTGVEMYFTCLQNSSTNAYLSCASGQSGGTFSAQGNGSITLTACQATCSNNAQLGMAIFYDRNNTSSVTVGGNGAVTINGSIYAKNSTFNYNGSQSGSFALNSDIVVGSFSFSGQGQMSIDSAAAVQAPIPGKAQLSS